MTLSDKTIFCRFCGGLLVDRFIEGKDRLICDQCKMITYINPVPASAVVVLKDNKVLLVKRGAEPKKGMWCLPGGFMEVDESPEDCAIRELKEETALDANTYELLGLYSQKDGRYMNVLLMGYFIDEYEGSPIAADDAIDIGWFSYDELPRLAFKGHRYFIDLVFKQ
ncbi:MAG: NUDIX hydrolase [Candidatus Zixiibacteriota bacterium]